MRTPNPRHRSTLWLLALVALFACRSDEEASPAAAVAAAPPTALEAYVAAPDPAYAWERVATLEGDGVEAWVIDLTSQTWLTEAEVDRTLWKHWLTLFVPSGAASESGFLYITGGDNDDPAPSEIEPRFAAMAKTTGTVVAELRMVPNQPLTFAGEGEGPRSEDGLIAFGWDKYLRGGRDEWLARLPMTKAAVRAMDTITAAVGEAGLEAPTRFVVAGGSKRGWTTWTTAAVDDRVVAIAPLVIDLLNIYPSFVHHWQAYGFWAPAVGDYQEMRLMDWLGAERYDRLLAEVDPYSYRDRLTLPKLLVNASGDQFFLPDSSQFYFADLSGEKHLRYVPNTGHSLGGTDAFETVLAFYEAVLAGSERPRYDWQREGPNALRVSVDPQHPPTQVTLWQATNPEARDFRVDVIGKTYAPTVLEAGEDGSYRAEVADPASGWSAFFVELSYPGVGEAPLKFTTEVRVVPDTLPFPEPVPDLSVLAGR